MSNLQNDSRRQFLKKSVYIVPLVLTLKAAPALAGQGSGPVNTVKRRRRDCAPSPEHKAQEALRKQASKARKAEARKERLARKKARDS